MRRQTELLGGFNIRVPSILYPFKEEIYDYNAFFEICKNQH